MVPTKDMDRNVFKFAELVSVHLLHREKKKYKRGRGSQCLFSPGERSRIFKPWQKKSNHNFSFSLGGQLLTQPNATKFLGVYIDEHLTWKDYISCLCKQISKSIGMLFRSRFYLSSKTNLTLYYSLIFPYITYCNFTKSSTYVTYLNRIYCLQKRAVQAITNSDYRAHSAPLFSKLKILDIH